MKKIEFKEVSSQYRKSSSPQIQNVSFTIDQGELILLAGPSGSGKSTLVLLMNGIIPHHTKAKLTGTISIFGKNPKDLSVLEMSSIVGMLLQDPESQLATTKVLDELIFTLEFMGKNPVEISTIVDNILRRFELKDLEFHDTTRMSGGEKQLVALAAMMTLDPEIIILDEPTSNLDPVNTKKVLKHVQTFKEEGRTVILIEHKINEVFNYCSPDRMLLMHDGKILHFDKPINIFKGEQLASIGLEPPQISKILALNGFPPFTNNYYPTSLKEFEVYIQTIDNTKIQRLRELLKDKSRLNLVKEEPLIVFENLSLKYRNSERFSLINISLTIKSGELIAIIGNNGAGKSSLIKHIISLLKPNTGKVLIKGIDTNNTTSAKLARTISFLFQNPDNQIFNSTVLNEVKYGPEKCGINKNFAKKSAQEAIESVNLSSFIDQNPIKLSMGQKQRVAVASALAMKPEVIVLDEPTTGQDPTSLKGIIELMMNEYRNDTTIILVTHDINLVDEIANRIVTMNDGEIKKIGSTDEVFNDYSLLESCNLEPPIRLKMLRMLEK